MHFKNMNTLFMSRFVAPNYDPHALNCLTEPQGKDV